MPSPEGVKSRSVKEDAQRHEELVRREAGDLRALGDRAQNLQSARVHDARRLAEGRKAERPATDRKPAEPRVDDRRVVAERSAFNRLREGRPAESHRATLAHRPPAEGKRVGTDEAPRAAERAREAVATERSATRIATDKAPPRVRDSAQAGVDPRLTGGTNLAATAAQTAQKGPGLFSGLVKALAQILRPTPTATPTPALPNLQTGRPLASSGRPGDTPNALPTSTAAAQPTKPARVSVTTAPEGVDVDQLTGFLDKAFEGLARFLPDAASSRFSVAEAAHAGAGQVTVGRTAQRQGSGSSRGSGGPLQSAGPRGDLATAVAVQLNGRNAQTRS